MIKKTFSLGVIVLLIFGMIVSDIFVYAVQSEDSSVVLSQENNGDNGNHGEGNNGDNGNHGEGDNGNHYGWENGNHGNGNHGNGNGNGNGNDEDTGDTGDTEDTGDAGDSEDTGDTEDIEDTGNEEIIADMGDTDDEATVENTENIENTEDTEDEEVIEDTGDTDNEVTVENTEDIEDTENTEDTEDNENIEDTGDTGDTEDTETTENIADEEGTGDTEYLGIGTVGSVGGGGSIGGGGFLIKDFCPAGDDSPSYYDRSCVASTVDAAVLFSESSVQDAEAIVPLESSIVSPVLASYVSHNRAPLVTLVVPLVEEPSITLAPVVSKTSGARLSFSRSSHFLNYLFVPLGLFFLYCLFLQAKRLDKRALLLLKNNSF